MSTTCVSDSASATDGQPQLKWSELSTTAWELIKTQGIRSDIELPALPQAVTEFVDQSSHPDFDVPKLASIIEKDAGLTCELLRYVNSAGSGLSSKLGNVSHALNHLGTNTARTYLMAAGVKTATRSQQSRLLNPRHFWNTSLQRGLFARAIAGSLKLDTGLCFMGGLLTVLTNRFDLDYIR
jgi:HD-like signal output (HDOD) protein